MAAGPHSERSSRAPRWELSREAFDQLLDALDPDREAASRRYEGLRRRLIDLFAWEGTDTPEELADETFNRLARRVSAGVSFEGSTVERFTFGIARLLLHEALRARRAREAALRELPARDPRLLPVTAAEVAQQRRLQRLDRCLDALSPESRELIQRYYASDRDLLARTLGLTVNALRNRALRIRQQLSDCLSRHRDV
jgi:DNA-directed RNA polymerase specialized sigma24 family protein